MAVERDELYEVKRQLEAADDELRDQITNVERMLRGEFTAAVSGLNVGLARVEEHLTQQDGTLQAWGNAVKSTGKWLVTIVGTVTAFVILHYIFRVG